MSFDVTDVSEERTVSRISREIEIPPGSDYVIRFDPQALMLNGQDIEPSTQGLSDNIIAAIAKSPRWIQRRLAGQFHTLPEPDSYANLLLNSSKQYADEIAFSIACCPSGKVPSAQLLKENAEAVYEQDKWISYADIIEYDDGTGDYCSTLRYTVLENGTEKHLTLPSEIYYWYVVHPKITNEEIDAVYGPLWRNYLFLHNDRGYPLLKEKISTIQYLWDCESYFQPQARLWSESIAQHPTAIEAVSYWIGKTVPAPAVGDRPVQASVIAHQHNGWCGELQKIAIAAQRAVLIPSIAACNVGEDHVWREFYERGWHENDNWWSDTGGAVDKPFVYAYDWGKNMSAVYQWRGDGTIMEDTTRYIRAEDRITVSFEVKDIFQQPVDGARVVVLVKGPKDITYYKHLLWEKMQEIWDRLPQLLKGKLLTVLFEKFEERFDALPDIINGATITIWNYTDSDGRCRFELGKNCTYLFFIQQGSLRKPWQLARHNILRRLTTPTDKEYKIVLLDVSHKPQRVIHEEMSAGDCHFRLSFFSSAYQLQKHFITDGIGRHETFGTIECFFVDHENFQRYTQGKAFTACHYLNAQDATVSVSSSTQEWYLVFRNKLRDTYVLVDFSLDVSVQTMSNHVQIVAPDSSLFETPMYNVGDMVLISGIATTEMVSLCVDDAAPIECPVVNGDWSYAWNTSDASLGTHNISVRIHGNISDEKTILLIDALPPSLFIESPLDGAIVEQGMLYISGRSYDNLGMNRVEVTLQNQTKVACGTTFWNLSWDLTGIPRGDHTLTVTAVDAQGLATRLTRLFVINESGHTWGPEIIALYHEPGNLTNTSNVIIYANVTTTGPFALHSLILFCNDGNHTTEFPMYRYGDFPVQTRHPEDPLFNQPNDPLFGKELGQFASGQVITYWIVAVDTAQNKKQSDVSSFTIL